MVPGDQPCGGERQASREPVKMLSVGDHAECDEREHDQGYGEEDVSHGRGVPIP
jgi:hypothetical protein